VLLVGFMACTKTVSIELPDAKDALVLNTFLTADSLIYVRLTKAINYLETGTNPRSNLQNPEVYLYENDVLLEKLTTRTINRLIWYTATTKARIGSRYKLLAKADGFEEVEGEAIVPAHPEIDELNFSRIPGQKITTSFKLSDKAVEKNYYRLRFLVNSKPVSSLGTSLLKMKNLNVSNNDFVLDAFNEYKYAVWYFDDSKFDGKAVDIKFQSDDELAFPGVDSVTYISELSSLFKRCTGSNRVRTGTVIW
jgi:Domain of unknown function (DUF4249)